MNKMTNHDKDKQIKTVLTFLLKNCCDLKIVEIYPGCNRVKVIYHENYNANHVQV